MVKGPIVSGDALDSELARIATLNLDELKAMFLKLTGVPLPKFMRTALMRRAVAHTLQEKVMGGLDKAAQKQLDQLVKQIVPSGQAPPPKPNRKLRAGTRLVREWRGKVHEVAVTKDGYVWSGACYASLSEIAYRITGTRWNGWVFFGLKKSGAKTPPDKAASGRRRAQGRRDASEVAMEHPHG